MNRSIIHLRVHGFPAALEQLRDSSLRGRPLVVAARHTPRALVFSASPEAEREGVRPGVPLTTALKRCRRLAVLPPDPALYEKAGREIVTVLNDWSPLVESCGWGRFFMDMSGSSRLFGSAQDCAFRMRRRVEERLPLGSTLGIGANKLVSGVAAVVIRSHGDLYSVPAGSEASFLAPLRARLLPALRDRRDRERMRELNIGLIEQLAALSLPQLAVVFRRRAPLVRRQSLGIDDTPVRTPSAKPFLLEETTLAEDSNDDSLVLGELFLLLERACRRMRRQGVLPRTVWLHLRYADGLDVTRRSFFSLPTLVEGRIFQELELVYRAATQRRQRIRYLSLTFTDLIPPSSQLILLERRERNEREERLVLALDGIRDRFGHETIRWGRTFPAREISSRRAALPSGSGT